MTQKPPLRAILVHHPESKLATSVAKGVYHFLADGGSGPRDMRLPIAYTPLDERGDPPSNLDLDVAEHTVVVVLADSRMARRVDGGSGPKYSELLGNLLEKAPIDSSPHCVLPVALDPGAFELDRDRFDERSFERLDIFDDEQLLLEELVLHIMVWALVRLQQQATCGSHSPAATPVVPIELFISHAKKDLPRIRRDASLEEQIQPVYGLLSHLATTRINGWFDAKKIPPGGRFPDEIRRGVLTSSGLVCVVTDSYGSREWCRREVLEAKKVGRPMIVVDALTDRDARLFPYLGNAPAIRWRGKPDDPRRVFNLAVREALRYQYHRRLLGARQQPGDLVLGTAPETLTLGLLHPRPARILYPDPPLGREELEVIAPVAGDTPLVTPLAALASLPRSQRVRTIGLSLSGSTDIRRYGVHSEHLATLSHDLCLFLLMAGQRLAYGGRIGHDAERPDEIDFTTMLFGLVRSYWSVAEGVGVTLLPIVNYSGWPLYLRYDEAELNLYGDVAELVKVDPPEPLGLSDEEMSRRPDEFFPSDSPARRFAWARGMTAMRERMNAEVDARVVMGGKLDGYWGIYPGVLEEALLLLNVRKPLYLIGAFGGAARLVIEVLLGKDMAGSRRRPELDTDWVRTRVPDYDATVALFRSANLPYKAPEEIREELRGYRSQGLQAVLNNGLNDEDNRRLFFSTDPHEMVELILNGLANLRD